MTSKYVHMKTTQVYFIPDREREQYHDLLNDYKQSTNRCTISLYIYDYTLSYEKKD
jgi:hypothetical protein